MAECLWCHTEVETPCSTGVECRTCKTPYTLTPDQAARVREIVSMRRSLGIQPLPIEAA